MLNLVVGMKDQQFHKRMLAWQENWILAIGGSEDALILPRDRITPSSSVYSPNCLILHFGLVMPSVLNSNNSLSSSGKLFLWVA